MWQFFKKENFKVRVFTLFMLSAILLVALSGCSSKDNIPNPAVSEIGEKIAETVDLSDMKELDDNKLQKLYGINPDKIDEYWGLIPASNINAQEILVIKVKDPADIKQVEEKISERVNEQRESFKDYLPEQCFLIEQYVLKHKGNYVFLAISKDLNPVEDTFDSFFK